MSIFQEFEEIRNFIGHDKYDNIETYINTERDDLRLDEIIYNKEKFTEYNNWYHEHIKNRNVEILDYWDGDSNNTKCMARLFRNNYDKGIVVCSFDNNELEGTIDEKNINKLKSLIYENFENYIDRKKLSECSKLLIDLYEGVSSSDNSMCYITDDDWCVYYSMFFNEKDIDILKKDVKNYKLENLIQFDVDDFKIIAYGDLQNSFIDDRCVENIFESEIITEFDKIEEGKSYTVARVRDNDHCVELHYCSDYDIPITLEYSVKIEDDYWKNEIEDASWFNKNMEEKEVISKMWNLFNDYFDIKHDLNQDKLEMEI